MILDQLDYFNSKRIVLASQSPRRSNLLKEIGLHFEKVPANCEENTIETDPIKRALYNANLKAEAVAKLTKPFDLIIACDTVVAFEREIFEKPANKDDAFRILSRLSGKSHQVITAVSLLFETKHIKFHQKTDVEFFRLQNAFITRYIDSGEPMDKAGAYGIQGTGSSFVKQITGCYYNVMGLPVSRICDELIQAKRERLI